MDAELMEKARAGLQAWQDGDLAALKELLDPDVELFWWEPGDWDCRGRDDVAPTPHPTTTRGSKSREGRVDRCG